jgi:hypothetical protein
MQCMLLYAEVTSVEENQNCTFISAFMGKPSKDHPDSRAPAVTDFTLSPARFSRTQQ